MKLNQERTEEAMFKLIGLVWGLSINTNFPIKEFNIESKKIMNEFESLAESVNNGQENERANIRNALKSTSNKLEGNSSDIKSQETGEGAFKEKSFFVDDVTQSPDTNVPAFNHIGGISYPNPEYLKSAKDELCECMGTRNDFDIKLENKCVLCGKKVFTHASQSLGEPKEKRQ